MATNIHINLPKDQKIRNYLLVKPEIKWIENQPNVEVSTQTCGRLPLAEQDRIFAYVRGLMDKEIAIYTKHLESRKKRADYSWIQTVMKSGTISDRMAAMIILVQDSPVHNLNNIDDLIAMVNVKAKRECLMAIDTLRDLFLGDLLIGERKLKRLAECPISQLMESAGKNRDLIDKQLLLWYFEDELKKRYVEFVEALDQVSRDVVENTKIKALSTMYQLLVSNGEHEQVLLKKLINKLGDPKHRIAALAIQKLNHLVTQHPNMKGVIVTEVEQLLFRPNLNPRAQYYGICFLNQLLLSMDNSALASHLIAIYFGFFKACVKKNTMNTKMMSALLTGVNRAYPYAQGETEKINEQINIMFKVVHTVRFQIGVQALMLIHHVLDSKHAISDRYYSALYRKLIDPQLKHSTRLASFFNLMFKSLQADDNLPRLQAFVKRLLQIALSMTAPIASAILILISEIARIKPKVFVLEQHDALVADDDDECFKDVETGSQMGSDHEKSFCLGESDAEDVTEEKPTIVLHNGKLSSLEYDPLKRNPRYANAGITCTWELNALTRHAHPTVALFAKTLLDGDKISYTGDPLQDFTLIRFLDRFVYRNPKVQEVDPEANQKRLIFGRRKLYKPPDVRRIPVNSNQFVAKKETNIPVDEMFMHKYFSQQAERMKAFGYNKHGDHDNDDNASVKSEEFEEYLTKCEPGGDMDDLDDLDFSNELSKPKNVKGKQVAKDESSESESDEFEDDEFTEAFKEFDDEIADAKKVTQTFDEEAACFSDDELGPTQSDFPEFVEADQLPAYLKRKKDPGAASKKKSMKRADDAAEEFAEMMDENANTKFDFSSINALANKDNADVKQLKWEMNRDRWIRDTNWKKSKQNKLNVKKGKMVTKARPQKSKLKQRTKKAVGKKRRQH